LKKEVEKAFYSDLYKCGAAFSSRGKVGPGEKSVTQREGGVESGEGKVVIQIEIFSSRSFFKPELGGPQNRGEDLALALEGVRN